MSVELSTRPDRGMTWPRRASVALLLASTLGGCGLFKVHGLDMVTDNRLTFLAPHARALVSAPLTVRWSMPGPAGDGRYFAVFVDRPPIEPGQSLKAVASGDAYCEHTPGCPDATYLAQRGVYLARGTSVSIADIPDLPSNRDRVQLHTIVVVVMSADGRRSGESAWRLEVRLHRSRLA